MWHINHNKSTALYRQGKYTEALSFIDKAIAQNPVSIDFYLFKKRALEKAWKNLEALKLLSQIQDKWVDVSYAYANAIWRNLSYRWYMPATIEEDAKQLYKQIEPWFDREYYMWLLSPLDKNNYFEKALTFSTNNPQKFITIAEKLKYYKDLAIKAYDKAVLVSWNDVKYISLRALYLLKNKDYLKAYSDFKKLWNTPFTENVVSFIESKEYEKTAKISDYIKQKAEAFIDAWDLEKGLNMYLWYIDLKPLYGDIINAYYTIWWLYFKLSKYDDSIKYFDEILTFEKFGKDNDFALNAYNFKIHNLVKKWDLKQALQHALVIKNVFPDNERNNNIIETLSK